MPGVEDALLEAIGDPNNTHFNYEAHQNIRKIALSPRFIFISLQELRYINDSDYPFNFSGDDVQIQKIILYLTSCDFYAMYCDKFFRTIEIGIQHRIFTQWHMYNELPNNMVGNYIRYVMCTNNIADYGNLLIDEPPNDDLDYDEEFNPIFPPASTQYYIIYSPFMLDSMYAPNWGYSHDSLCYQDIFPHHLEVSVRESEGRRVFSSRKAVVDRQIYYAVNDTWRIVVEGDSELIDRIRQTTLADASNSNACRPPTKYVGPELPLPRYHTNNWWLNLHNFTLTVDDMMASRKSMDSLVAFDYIGAFLHTHKNDFDDYPALADVALDFIANWLNSGKNELYSLLYVNADPQYYLDFYQQHEKLFPNSLMRSLCLLRYLLLRAYQRTITVKDLETYYLYLPTVLRKEFVNELFTLPICDFNLFYPFIVDACPSDGDNIAPPHIRQMSFNKTSIGYHTSPTDPSHVKKLKRTRGQTENPSFVGFVFDGYPDEPAQMSSTLYHRAIELPDGGTATIFSEEAPIILSVDTSMFETNPCGFEGICSNHFNR